jgi:hypothetical protein
MTFCVAVDARGDAVRWNGAHWSAPTRVAAAGFTGVSCASDAFCAAPTPRDGGPRNRRLKALRWRREPVQYAPLITKKEPRITPANFDFWRANLKPAAASSSGTSMPSESLNPTARLPWSAMVYITLMDRPDW